MSSERTAGPSIPRFSHVLYYTCWALLRVIFALMGRLQVVGRKNVPRRGGVILVPNHSSYADPPLMGVAAVRPLRYMAKAELFRNPLQARFLSVVGAYIVHRGASDREALKLTLALLAAGEAVIIFGEGHTSLDGRLQPPELGLALLALKARVPVVPVAILGSNDFMPYKGKGFHRARLQVIFGEPLDFSQYWEGLAGRKVLQEVSATVMRRVADLLIAHGAGARVPDGYLESPIVSDQPVSPEPPAEA